MFHIKVFFPSQQQLHCHYGDANQTSLTKIWHPPKCASSQPSDTLRVPTISQHPLKNSSCPPPDLLDLWTRGKATGSPRGAGSSLATQNQSQAETVAGGVSVKLLQQSVRGHAFQSSTYNTHSLLCHQCFTHAFLNAFLSFSLSFAFTMQQQEPRNTLH